jgi:hypothetical protein
MTWDPLNECTCDSDSMFIERCPIHTIPIEEPIETYYNGHTCLIEAFFKAEALKPAHMRSNSCMISCSCPKCRVYC